MIVLQILWAVICVSVMGWSFWRFGKSVMDADRTIQRDKELADYYGKIADNRRDELNAQLADLAPLIQERDRLRSEVDAIEQQISFKAQFDRKRLFLITDRRAPEDLEWHVPVALRDGFGMIWHPDVARSWIRGRKIIVWARGKEQAKRAVTARLPESSGFIVGEPAEGREFAPIAPAAATPADDEDAEAEPAVPAQAPPAITDTGEEGGAEADPPARGLSALLGVPKQTK